MKEVNNITICKEDYSSKEEFEQAINKAVMCLLENNYIMTVRYDDKGLGIVSIDFNYDNLEYGGNYPFWLTADEYEEHFLDSQENDDEGE